MPDQIRVVPGNHLGRGRTALVQIPYSCESPDGEPWAAADHRAERHADVRLDGRPARGKDMEVYPSRFQHARELGQRLVVVHDVLENLVADLDVEETVPIRQTIGVFYCGQVLAWGRCEVAAKDLETRLTALAHKCAFTAAEIEDVHGCVEPNAKIAQQVRIGAENQMGFHSGTPNSSARPRGSTHRT
jgi:hypothetical protein